MSITIIGTGNMARSIAVRALESGYGLQLLGRNPDKIEALATYLGAPATARVTTGAVGDEPTGDIVVLAVPYAAAGAVAARYGDALADKVVVDISNPLNETYDALVTVAGSSAAEEIAALLPRGARLVKAFNTTFAGTLESGQAGGEPLDIFVAGDDTTAKAQVTAFVEAGGLRVIDAGGLSAARALEAFQLLHIATQFTRGTQFATAIRVVG